MSGGAYDWAYRKVEEMAEQIECEVVSVGISRDIPPPPYRVRFAAVLKEVAKTMRAIEWSESADTGIESEEKAISDFYEWMKREASK